jgi:ABC-type lipoprotein export system ATPase subunit
LIRFTHVTKTYRAKKRPVSALVDLSFEIAAGEFVAVVGPSGCGKTTLLMAAGGMLQPTQGTVEVGGADVYSLTPAARAAFRAREIGFVFQMFHLIPYLNVLENVELGPRPDGIGRGDAARLLERLGLSHRASHKPSELSAGEKQRAAIARALLSRPKVILADEPTGNLDPDNEREVFEILRGFHREGGTVVVVTHGDVASAHAGRRLRLEDGRLVEDARA